MSDLDETMYAWTLPGRNEYQFVREDPVQIDDIRELLRAIPANTRFRVSLQQRRGGLIGRVRAYVRGKDEYVERTNPDATLEHVSTSLDLTERLSDRTTATIGNRRIHVRRGEERNDISVQFYDAKGELARELRFSYEIKA